MTPIAFVVIIIVLMLVSSIRIERTEQPPVEKDEEYPNKFPMLTLRAPMKKTKSGKKNLGKIEILERETERLTGFFAESFRGGKLHFEDHVDVKVYFDLTKPDEIVCDATALSETGANIIRRINDIMEEERKNL